MNTGTIPSHGTININKTDLPFIFMLQFAINKSHEIKAIVKDGNTNKALFRKADKDTEESTKKASDTKETDTFASILELFDNFIKEAKRIKKSYYILNGFIQGKKEHRIAIFYYVDDLTAEYKILKN